MDTFINFMGYIWNDCFGQSITLYGFTFTFQTVFLFGIFVDVLAVVIDKLLD